MRRCEAGISVSSPTSVSRKDRNARRLDALYAVAAKATDLSEALDHAREHIPWEDPGTGCLATAANALREALSALEALEASK